MKKWKSKTFKQEKHMYTKAMQIISSFDNSKSIWRIIFDQDPIPETQVCQNFP